MRNTAGVCEVTVTPVTCTLPKVLNVATNLCVTPVLCQLPKTMIDGVCALAPTTPMVCKDPDENSEHEAHEYEERHGSRLHLSQPGKLVVHAEEVLRLGVAAYGDERKITLGVNLPKGASFVESFNSDLWLQQGVLSWKVPGSAVGKTVKIKFCAEAHDKGSYGKEYNKVLVAHDVSVEVLPQVMPVVKSDPVVAASVISGAVYNPVMQQLEASGQVKWAASATKAQRKIASVKLSDADGAIVLGKAKIKANGKWSVAIPLLGASAPRAIDATFQGKVGTVLVKKLP